MLLDDLSPREAGVVRTLLARGWECQSESDTVLRLVSPQGDYWRVKADDRTVPDWVKEEAAGNPPPLTELLDRIVSRHLGVDLTDRTEGGYHTLDYVRSMLRQGYSAKQVVERTGWGGYWIADIVGPDGYYREKGIA